MLLSTGSRRYIGFKYNWSNEKGHITHDLWHMPDNKWHVTNRREEEKRFSEHFRSLPLGFMPFEVCTKKDQLLSKWVTHQPVCRTALATGVCQRDLNYEEQIKFKNYISALSHVYSSFIINIKLVILFLPKLYGAPTPKRLKIVFRRHPRSPSKYLALEETQWPPKGTDLHQRTLRVSL